MIPLTEKKDLQFLAVLAQLPPKIVPHSSCYFLLPLPDSLLAALSPNPETNHSANPACPTAYALDLLHIEFGNDQLSI